MNYGNVPVIDSLDLTALQRRANDHELLMRLAAHPGPIALDRLFGGWCPAWAADAADRLTVAGLAREVDGRTEVTPEGRKVASGERRAG